MIDKEIITLAEGLQRSNVAEVSQLAKAVLELYDAYQELEHEYVLACAETVMVRHADTLKRLKDSGD